MLRLVCLLLLVSLPFSDMRAQDTSHAARAATAVERISGNGPAFFAIHAQGFVRATPQQAWRVLTDYERLPEFVPHLRVSTILSRNGHEVLLEQETQTGFVFISQTIRMQLKVTERPQSGILVRMVSGDLRSYQAEWELTPAIEEGAEGTRVSYKGSMEPDFFLPPLVGESLVRKDVDQMVEAVMREIERQAQMQ